MLATRRPANRLERLPKPVRRIRALRQRPGSRIPSGPSSRRPLLPRRTRRSRRNRLHEHAEGQEEFRDPHERRQIPPVFASNCCSRRCCRQACSRAWNQGRCEVVVCCSCASDRRGNVHAAEYPRNLCARPWIPVRA